MASTWTAHPVGGVGVGGLTAGAGVAAGVGSGVGGAADVSSRTSRSVTVWLASMSILANRPVPGILDVMVRILTPYQCHSSLRTYSVTQDLVTRANCLMHNSGGPNVGSSPYQGILRNRPGPPAHRRAYGPQEGHASAAELLVSLTWPEPSAFITYISKLLTRSE